jgi:hypothetical protein
MGVDVDVVLWSLRALPNADNRALRADEIARFIAKDTTVSEHYSEGDVAGALEELVADGFVVSESSDAATLYRLTPLLDDSDVALAEPAPAWELGLELDTWRKRAEDAEQDVARANREANDLRIRVHALESTLEQHRALTLDALTAEQEVDVLRARVRVLESKLERERAVTVETSETVRRATNGTGPAPRRAVRGNWLR